MANSGTGNVLRSLLFSKRFSEGFTSGAGKVRIGDLNTPVTLARTRLIPDSDTGFDRRVRVYGRGWAKVMGMERKLVQGKSSGVDITHTFQMRHDPSYTIDSRDMLFAESEIYVVGKVKDATQDFPFVTVYATHAGSMDEHDLTLVEPGEEGEEIVPTPEAEDNPESGTDFPIWS